MRMKSKILGISAVCLLMFAERGKTQNNPYNEVSIASPNAASLGKFVDLPVNYHTGLPQVDIPIYTIKEGTLSVPVSLSYHTGGLKITEPASWVGANWALNAGGAITRNVSGAPYPTDQPHHFHLH